jgi:hypothetical protein
MSDKIRMPKPQKVVARELHRLADSYMRDADRLMGMRPPGAGRSEEEQWSTGKSIALYYRDVSRAFREAANREEAQA